MPEEITWTVTESSGEVKKVGNVNKIPYVATQRQNDKMTDSQKEGVRVWNLMVQTLRDNGLMEEKKEGA
jgi:hypothetical protein